MNILHLIAGDLSGGAARGAYWLHRELIDKKINSQVLTTSRVTMGDKNVTSISLSGQDWVKSKIRSYLDSSLIRTYRNRKRDIFSPGIIGYDFTKTLQYKNANIIHLHWINAGLVNIKILRSLDKPIVWSMRDLWPVTGGCHIPLECDKLSSGCGECPHLGSNSKYDLSRFVFKRKEKYIPHNVKLVGISDWVSSHALKSNIFCRENVLTINNGLDVKEYFPIEKKYARLALGINTDKKIILCGAQSIQHSYKGFGKFKLALKNLDRQKYIVITFGRLEESVTNDIEQECINFEFLHDTPSLRLLYSAADVFVAPSLMEPFGKTLIEAMACGTPVVCFNSTGPKDIVTHQYDGYMAEPFNEEDLAVGIEWVTEDATRHSYLVKNAVQKVKSEFDIKLIATKYIDLYKSLI